MGSWVVGKLGVCRKPALVESDLQQVLLKGEGYGFRTVGDAGFLKIMRGKAFPSDRSGE